MRRPHGSSHTYTVSVNQVVEDVIWVAFLLEVLHTVKDTEEIESLLVFRLFCFVLIVLSFFFFFEIYLRFE